MAIETEGFGIKVNSDQKISAPGAYLAAHSMVTLANAETGTGEISVCAVLPSQRTFQIDNPGGGDLRIDVSNDPDLGWYENYIITNSTTDFYSTNEPWHYVRVYIETQGSPAGITVKMGV